MGLPRGAQRGHTKNRGTKRELLKRCTKGAQKQGLTRRAQKVLNKTAQSRLTRRGTYEGGPQKGAQRLLTRRAQKRLTMRGVLHRARHVPTFF